MRRMHQSEIGSTLIEVLIALLVLSVGLLGLAALQLNALRGVSDSSQRSQATWILQDIAERIRANPDALDASYTTPANCGAVPAKFCADHFQPGTGAVKAENCTEDEMAAFDIWETQCSYAAVVAFNTIDGRYSSRDFLSLPPNGETLRIDKTGNVLTITANWQGQADDAKKKNKAFNAGDETTLSIGDDNSLQVTQ